jgi:hypothetical protein
MSLIHGAGRHATAPPLTHTTMEPEGPAEELPIYSRNPGPRTGTTGSLSEHRYALRDKNGRDRLSLHFKSRANNPKHTPLFLEGDTIRGEVRLDLAKAETLKGITITVCPESRCRFLHLTFFFFWLAPDKWGYDSLGP